MPKKNGRISAKRVLALLTILAIAGTLSACGRYGSPVRPKASLAYLNLAALDLGAVNQGVKAQRVRTEKSIRNDLRTPTDLVSSVFRSSVH